MKKSYITTVPDQIGAFQKASRCFAQLGINITRVSYNRAIDSHTLFIDAEGTPEQLAQAEAQLAEIGYLRNGRQTPQIALLEFELRDIPNSVTDVLELISSFGFNISYVSSQENGTAFQYFRVGLLVDDGQKLNQFMEAAEKLWRVRVIGYNQAEKVFDNSIFYNSFVSGIVQMSGVSENLRNELLVDINMAMQMLDERGLSPYRTFDSIGRFAELLAQCKADAFQPRISEHRITDNTVIHLIEPACGSNTAIIISGEEVLFVDSGYACYREEMEKIFRSILPEFDRMHKRILITHADLDHCGLLDLFDEVLLSKKSAQCLMLEHDGKNGFRERNPLHKPYINMCKLLSAYRPANPEKLHILWDSGEEQTQALVQTGFFDFGDLHFEVYEGKGGHLPGEIVLIDYEHKIAFTGDIYINIHGMIPEQSEYNRYAPVLMTSVDTDPKLCAQERNAVLQRLGAGQWRIFGGHGFVKEYSVANQA